MRVMVSSSKGARPGIEARGQFDALMESVLPRGDVTFEADTLGGVPGLWVHPADWRSGEAIVHLHGGWRIRLALPYVLSLPPKTQPAKRGRAKGKRK